MTIILTGGGSGGHITPLLAVARELKRINPDTRLVYFGQKGDSFAKIVGENPEIDDFVLVRAGKFRRFHGEGLKQFLNLNVFFKNLRDFFYVIIGIIESSWKIRKLHAQVVFSRGGYVSVPVALGAKLNKVPYITHDSDPIPSLANRIIAPWAALHAVALPKEIYPYPLEKTITTGIPLNHEFVPVSNELKKKYRQDLELATNAKMLFVIGGGLGSLTLNNAVADAAPELLRRFSDLYIYHVAGQANEVKLKERYIRDLTEKEQGRVKVLGFVNDVYKLSGAADVIVSRAGATNLAEFALQCKPVIIVPSPFLTGGHQVKNAEYLMEKEAALMVSEDDIETLGIR
ncbi:MAG TPA: UDP-N-acetylglucosamine--N-acetylmuramyl-(pentapeptide) pyrophosphoryl-undecaprenol N-acetylglucosamine transferase, partial [Candidatus Saccharimonadales bacterium]|nr:UDP-N-acetylglucosamine--N-acetylmuramyl-(pentapeptide) pyrophosphoryl-undecaprenol N-acetylglucosamine transferase [Candidatus Saccharimonadales bacterium]